VVLAIVHAIAWAAPQDGPVRVDQHQQRKKIDSELLHDRAMVRATATEQRDVQLFATLLHPHPEKVAGAGRDAPL
jgi:hypothetical protein